MMENRSYDHYFGDYPRGRGFNDHPGALARRVRPGLSRRRRAWSRPTSCCRSISTAPRAWSAPTTSPTTGARCTCAGTTARWTPGSRCTPPLTYEGAHGAMTMGYYERADLPFYYALADAFTLCDALPLLDPRAHPSQSADGQQRHDRSGRHAGRPGHRHQCRPPTSCGTARGRRCRRYSRTPACSWKVYSPSNAGVSGKYASLTQLPHLDPGALQPGRQPGDHGRHRPRPAVLHGVSQPDCRPSITRHSTPTFPNDFVADVNSGSLPSVSWLIPPLGFDEHPVVGAGQRHVLHLAGPRRADRQPERCGPRRRCS